MSSILKIENLVVCKNAKNPKRHKGPKAILRGITTTFESGKINVIMGPNGSGKSTLLSMIYGVTDSETKTSGKILLNDKERDPETWFSEISIVQQSATYLSDNNTVKREIELAIAFKNVKSVKKSSIEEYSELFEVLNLVDIMDSKVNEISGGERHRVAMAVEILNDKNILILDEPTSDLDSYQALLVMLYLKKIALEKSKIVITTIHQPSGQIISVFDNLLFMYSGCAIYSGPFDKIREELKSKNLNIPQDWTIPEFLMEAYYGSSVKSIILEQMNSVEAHKNDIYNISDNIVKSSHVSNKSNKRIYFTPNVREIGILIGRTLREVFTSKGFILVVLSIFLITFLLFYVLSSISPPTPSKDNIKKVLHIAFPIFETWCEGDFPYYVNAIKKMIDFEPDVLKLLSFFISLSINTQVFVLVQNSFLRMFLYPANPHLKTLGTQEIISNRYRPVSYIISNIIAGIIIHLFVAGLLLLGLYISGILNIVYPLYILEIVLVYITNTFTAAFLDVFFSSIFDDPNIIATFRFSILLIGLFTCPTNTIIIKPLKAYNGTLEVCARAFFRCLDIIFPSNMISRLITRIQYKKLVEEGNGFLVYIINNEKFINCTEKVSFSYVMHLFRDSMNIFLFILNSRSGDLLFTEDNTLKWAIAVSLIAMPLATLVIFIYKYSPRISLKV